MRRPWGYILISILIGCMAYLDDSGKPQKSHSGCSALVAIFATVSILVIVFTMLITIVR